MALASNYNELVFFGVAHIAEETRSKYPKGKRKK
jgi:hypothetical protein